MSANAEFIERLLADEPALLSSLDFGPFVAQGTGAGPSLLIGDTSEISLMRSMRTSHLDHRMAHLAKPRDVVLVRDRDHEFEAYLKDYCGLEDVTFLGADPDSDEPVAKQAFTSKPLLRALVDVARQNGGLTIKSYLTTGYIWRLARAIGEKAGCIVHVSGPSPRTSRRANDKLWFTRLACAVLGSDAVPPTMSAYGPDAAAGLIARLSKQGQQVIVKVPDSAGSAGNIRLDKDAIESFTADKIRSLLLDRLHATGWSDSYPILVGVWDADVSCSPSVQMWIPHSADGPPEAHGVFEQRVFGEAAAFVGAVKSSLPDEVQLTLVEQALQIASALQRLGYYGKCSLDAVICGEDPLQIHWIECNGRWSGVSIPLTVLKTIAPDQIPDGILILQQQLQAAQIDTSHAISALHDCLYQRGSPAEGVVVLSPPAGSTGPVANLLVFAASQPDANRLGARAVASLKTA